MDDDRDFATDRFIWSRRRLADWTELHRHRCHSLSADCGSALAQNHDLIHYFLHRSTLNHDNLGTYNPQK